MAQNTETNPKIKQLIAQFPALGRVTVGDNGIYRVLVRLCYKPYLHTKNPDPEYGSRINKKTGAIEQLYTLSAGIPPEVDVSALTKALDALAISSGISPQGKPVHAKFRAIKSAAERELIGDSVLPVCVSPDWKQFNAKSYTKPVVSARKGGALVPLAEEQIWGGCWALVGLTLGSYKGEKNSGTSVRVNDVLLILPDERVEGSAGAVDPSAGYQALGDLPDSAVDDLFAADTGSDNYMDDGIPF